MKTCEVCGREHGGRGRWCPQCNNPGKVPSRQPGRKQFSSERAGALEMADMAARAEREGWAYEDDDDDDPRR